MSSNPQAYTTANVYINGSLLAEEASVTVKRASNSQEIKSVAKGYSGESPGAAMCEVSVESNVPADDFEFDASKAIGEIQVVEFTIFAAGRTLTFKGSIVDDSFSHAVDSPSKLSFNARGAFASWN